MTGCHLLQGLADEPLGECFTLSCDTQDFQPVHLDVVEGGFGLLMSDAKATASECLLVRLVRG